MKSTSKKRTPSIVNLTVKRRYLTQREIDRLMDCARKYGRYGHRDATMILVAYRHGLRASEVCDLQWQQIELSEAACTFTGSRTGFPACTQSAVTRCERCASYAAITRETPTYSFPSAAGQSAPSVSTASSSASAKPPRCHFRSTHTCFATPVGSSSQVTVTTRAPSSTTSGTRTSSTRFGTPKWHLIASRTFGGTDGQPARVSGAGSAAASTSLPSTILAPCAWASNDALRCSIMASSSSSVSSLSGLLCSTLCSRGTSGARILR